MNLALSPGRRLIFRNCELVKRTSYEKKFRDEMGVVWRQAFSSPDYDGRAIVYSGKLLPLKIGDIRDIKGTIKFEQNFGAHYNFPQGVNFLHISRPILIDILPPPFTDC